MNLDVYALCAVSFSKEFLNLKLLHTVKKSKTDQGKYETT